MKLVNTNNEGVVEIPEELAKELLASGIWKELKERKPRKAAQAAPAEEA